MASVVIAGDTSGTVTLAAPATAGTTTLTLPTTNGTLITTGSSGQSIPKAALPTGSVLQVLQTVKSDTFSTSSTSATDITGLSVSITPTSSTSKILVMYDVKTSMENFQMSLFLVRNSTAIYIGDAAGSRIRASSAICAVPDPTGFWRSAVSQTSVFLDSPATTSATTYKVQCQVNAGTGYVNRSGPDQDDVFRARTPSSITVMEIAA